MSFPDNGLPLFIPVLVLYDYTTNQIRDVVEDNHNPNEDLVKIEEPEDDNSIMVRDNCCSIPVENNNIILNEEEPPIEDEDDDDWYY